MVKLTLGNDDVTVEEDAPKRSAVGRILWFAAHLVAGVAVFGVALWLKPFWMPQPLEGPPKVAGPIETLPTATTALQEAPVAPTELDPVDQMARADRLLRSGNYTAALRIYNELQTSWSDGDPTLVLRRAMCLEFIGELDHAFMLYQSLMENSERRRIVAAAQLGQARVWYRKAKPGPARILLYSLAMSSGQDEAVAASAFHLLASVSVEDAFQPDKDLMNEQTIVSPDPMSDTSWLFVALDSASSPTETAVIDDLENVERFSADLREIRLGLTKYDANLGKLINSLAAKAQLEIKPSAAAGRVMNARTVRVNVRDIDFATWLDGVLEAAGLLWFQRDDVVHIRLATEIKRSDVSRLRRSQAERLCRSALTLYPEHPLAVSTFLVLGNIHFWNGEYEDAANSYEEVRRRATNQDILRLAWFNLSRTELQLNDFEAVRKATFKFVDLSRGHAHEAVGYLFLGRQFLDNGQPDNAIRQFVRAISLARENDIKRFAIESLATAYLVQGNPVAASMALMDHRDLLRGEPFESKAAFLSSLARFRASSLKRDRVRLGRSLASSVAHVDANRFFCFAANILIGSAYLEIGLPSQTQAVYVDALKRARPNDVRDQIMFALGTLYVDDGKVNEGETLMEQLVEEGHAPWASRARFYLADIAIQKRDFEVCLQRCHEILEQPLTIDEKRTVLTLMGRAYEQNLDHYKAALCFAGLIPTTDIDGKTSAELLDQMSGESAP